MEKSESTVNTGMEEGCRGVGWRYGAALAGLLNGQQGGGQIRATKGIRAQE